jgi:hypothetical protein
VTIFARFRSARERPLAPVPLAPLSRPLAECRLALVVSSVCLAPAGRGVGRGVALGDPSFREIQGDIVTADLLARAQGADASSIVTADLSAANLDRNLAFALDRLREAVAAGRLGELNRRHLALGGAMAATGRAIVRRAPQAADWLTADGVEAVLLVPT